MRKVPRLVVRKLTSAVVAPNDEPSKTPLGPKSLIQGAKALVCVVSSTRTSTKSPMQAVKLQVNIANRHVPRVRPSAGKRAAFITGGHNECLTSFGKRND